MTYYTEKEMHEKLEIIFSKMEKQFTKEIQEIQEKQPFDLSFHVYQASLENAYMSNPSEFDNNKISEDTLHMIAAGSESIIESFHKTGWY